MTKKSKAGKAKKRAPKNGQADNIDLRAAAAQDTRLHNMGHPAAQDAQADNAAITDNTEEASNMNGRAIVQDNTESGLLKLPAEIKQRIWTLAIALDESIKPIQIRERSNKFIWSITQIDPKAQSGKCVENAPLLTVVALSKVCRTLYEEVSLTHLFYKVNHFEFPVTPGYRVNHAIGPINYLVALTTARMKALRSITCDWAAVPKEASKLFALLAACDGLQNLELILHYDIVWSHFASVARVPGFRDALIAVEGLQTLRLRLPDSVADIANSSVARTRGQTLIGKLEPPLKERMKQARGTSKYNLETFLVAQREAKLDVHGDGRLGEDKKPGLIASRTRNQLRNLENLGDDGTIPKRVIPKYDADGDLAWQVADILDSRRCEPDGFPPSVEFRIKCAALTGAHSWDRSDRPTETSWEDINVLNNYRSWVVSYYNRHPGASGKEAVVEAWSIRDQDSGFSAKELKNRQAWTKQLASMAERESKLEQLRAEAAAKEAQRAAKEAGNAKKETKNAKKAKATKATKSKTFNH